MLGIEDEIERFDQIIIASEGWAKLYSKDPTTHAKLIKTEARMARVLRKYYRNLGDQASKMVDWSKYKAEIKAFNVEVLINDGIVEAAKDEFISIMIDQIATATTTGAEAGENIYKKPLGIKSTDAVIQEIAGNHVAELVTQVSDTVKSDIRSSIQDSIAAGETVQEATDRLSGIISDPDRAELIARTESVNSYGLGMKEFGNQSGAVGKEWQDTGAEDECADNTDEGPIPFESEFSSGDDAPAAHPNCRCSIRLIYQNELDDDPNLFD